MRGVHNHDWYDVLKRRFLDIGVCVVMFSHCTNLLLSDLSIEKSPLSAVAKLSVCQPRISQLACESTKPWLCWALH